MNTITRRQFSLFGASGVVTALLAGCGNDIISEDDVDPTRISDVPGAPVPTLADMATPGSEQGGDEEATPVDGGGSGDVIVIQALDTLKFEPDHVTAAPGQTIQLVHAGVVPHDFSVEEFGVPLIEVAAKGETGDWTVPDDAAPGDYHFFCSVPGHEAGGMFGTLTIVEAGAAPEGDGEESSESAGEEAPEEEAPAGGETSGGGATHELKAQTPYQWDVTEITAAPGDIIHVVSESPLAHDFAIDEFGGILIDLPSQGSEGTWEVPDQPGSYEYYCTIPGHRDGGMHGTLTIQ